MNPLLFTLLSDGSSDRALLPVLDWLLRQHSSRPSQPQWADLRALRDPPRLLPERIRVALELYPCDLLFVHRDAEGAGYAQRAAEIRACLRDIPHQAAVCVVPVRMQEAWLLFDGAALRSAADNPNGTSDLGLPPLDKVEGIGDPKRLLHELLWKASGLRPGRQRKWRPGQRVHRLAELIEDFSPLRRLPAFRALEDDLGRVVAERSWR